MGLRFPVVVGLRAGFATRAPFHVMSTKAVHVEASPLGAKPRGDISLPKRLTS
jgi:hypothetical protein